MNHHGLLKPLLIFSCFALLFLICFHRALDGSGQFGYRDAGHFYYPLYQRVQAEWDAGRWPLWEPEENSGMPLLGNPTAAVLYPGKLIYALVSYPWAARLYIVMHAGLAFVGMLITLRAWDVGWIGSGLGALSYAFGAPILFQYCNIIYLVGAAWLPLGFLTVDSWLRKGSHAALLGLAVVLSMQILGGDPQSAYLLGLSACAYALGLAWQRGGAALPATPNNGEVESRPSGRWWLIPVIVLGLIGWVVVTLYLAEIFPKMRPPGKPTPALPWMRYVPPAVLAAWGIIALVSMARAPDPEPAPIAPVDAIRSHRGGDPGGGPLRGTVAACPGVHPADGAGRGRRPARHLPFQYRAVSPGGARLAQRLGDQLRPKCLLDRGRAIAGDPTKDLGSRRSTWAVSL